MIGRQVDEQMGRWDKTEGISMAMSPALWILRVLAVPCDSVLQPSCTCHQLKLHMSKPSLRTGRCSVNIWSMDHMQGTGSGSQGSLSQCRSCRWVGTCSALGSVLLPPSASECSRCPQLDFLVPDYTHIPSVSLLLHTQMPGHLYIRVGVNTDPGQPP